MRNSDRLPQALRVAARGALPLVALILYAMPSSWHLEWRLAVSGAVRRAVGDLDTALPESDILQAEKDLAQDLVRLSLHDELAFYRQGRENIEVARLRHPMMKLVPARIVSAEASDPAVAILDRGRDDDVVRGDAVLLGGALLGVVIRTAPKASAMRFVSSREFRVTARTVGNPVSDVPELCLVEGMGLGRARVKFFFRGVQAVKDTALFTHGSENGLPDMMLIGYLDADPTDGNEAWVKEAPVRLAAEALRGLDVVVARSMGD